MNKLIEKFETYGMVYHIDSDGGFRIKFTRKQKNNGLLIVNAIYNSFTKGIPIFDGDLFRLYNKSSLMEKEELISYLNNKCSIEIDINKIY